MNNDSLNASEEVLGANSDEFAIETLINSLQETRDKKETQPEIQMLKEDSNTLNHEQ